MTGQTDEPPNPGGRIAAVELTESDRHRLLAAERRRLALDILAGRQSPVDLGALAEALAVRERTTDGDPGTVEDVAVDLYHRHLPLMADLGVVEFDPQAGRVEATPHAGALV